MWGFIKADAIERVHLQFCKKKLWVKKNTQNDFIYGELGRTNFLTKRYILIVKYWFKILSSGENKYLKYIYNLMLNDIDTIPNIVNWASLLKHFLSSLGFHGVWVNQKVSNYNAFIGSLRLRLTDTFIQNWRSRLEESSRAIFLETVVVFQMQPYLDMININKFSNALSRLRVSSHRLVVESGRWVKPIRIPFHERKYSNCSIIEDEYHFVIDCPFNMDLRQNIFQNTSG